MFLDSFNRYLLSVEDTGGQCGFHISLFKDLGEVLNLSGS